jgi:hypothetical protein
MEAPFTKARAHTRTTHDSNARTHARTHTSKPRPLHAKAKSLEESRVEAGLTLQQLVDYAFSNRVIFFNALDKQQVCVCVGGVYCWIGPRCGVYDWGVGGLGALFFSHHDVEGKARLGNQAAHAFACIRIHTCDRSPPWPRSAPTRQT